MTRSARASQLCIHVHLLLDKRNMLKPPAKQWLHLSSYLSGHAALNVDMDILELPAAHGDTVLLCMQQNCTAAPKSMPTMTVQDDASVGCLPVKPNRYIRTQKEDAEAVYCMLISCTDAITAYRRRALAWFVTASGAP